MAVSDARQNDRAKQLTREEAARVKTGLAVAKAPLALDGVHQEADAGIPRRLGEERCDEEQQAQLLLEPAERKVLVEIDLNHDGFITLANRCPWLSFSHILNDPCLRVRFSRQSSEALLGAHHTTVLLDRCSHSPIPWHSYGDRGEFASQSGSPRA